MTFNYTLAKYVKPLKDLPNTAGFSFSGVLKNDIVIKCFVRKSSSGQHQVVDANTVPVYSQLVSWF